MTPEKEAATLRSVTSSVLAPRVMIEPATPVSSLIMTVAAPTSAVTPEMSNVAPFAFSDTLELLASVASPVNANSP